jgi:hypothetical protein
LGVAWFCFFPLPPPRPPPPPPPPPPVHRPTALSVCSRNCSLIRFPFTVQTHMPSPVPQLPRIRAEWLLRLGRTDQCVVRVRRGGAGQRGRLRLLQGGKLHGQVGQEDLQYHQVCIGLDASYLSFSFLSQVLCSLSEATSEQSCNHHEDTTFIQIFVR